MSAALFTAIRSFCILACLACIGLANDSILLEFTSDGCAPCRSMEPIVSELIARGVPVRQVDVATEENLARRYGIRATPTYVVVNGGREVTRLTGMKTAEELIAALQVSASGPIVPTNSEFEKPQTRLAPIDPSVAFQASNVSRQTESHEFAIGSVELPPRIEAVPSVDLADAIQRAEAATVRLRVHDGRGYGAGTGTIIDVHNEEALVMTCGHLFRDGEGKGRIEVDLFIGGDVVTVEGQLIDYDADDRDIGLVAIRPGYPVQPVQVISKSQTVRTGEAVFSFGCDRGDDPSRRDTTVTGVNKYNQNIGASNLEIQGAPIDGRSGGGLFDAQGRLIGVCNAADYKSDLGIYTGPGAIHWQLDRVQLTSLYDRSDETTPASNSLQMQLASAAVPQSLPIQQPGASSEMIVILRDPRGGTDQVLTLDRPDAELIDRIRNAARR